MKQLTVKILLCLFVCYGRAYAQTHGKFDNDIKVIRAYDNLYKAPDSAILFIGSSSMRKWDGLQQSLGSYKVLNRGIGGAFINDIMDNIDPLIVHYKPRQIVLYVGDNDLTQKNETADTIVNRTINLYRLIKEKLPDVPVIYISLKPSPIREPYKDKLLTANQLLEKFFGGEKNAIFLNIYPLMLSAEGRYRKELFLSDMSHMNAQGYAIWEKAIKPYLLKL